MLKFSDETPHLTRVKKLLSHMWDLQSSVEDRILIRKVFELLLVWCARHVAAFIIGALQDSLNVTSCKEIHRAVLTGTLVNCPFFLHEVQQYLDQLTEMKALFPVLLAKSSREMKFFGAALRTSQKALRKSQSNFDVIIDNITSLSFAGN